MSVTKPKTTVKDARVQGLLEKARELPQSPGCYLMKNRKGEVIYVGKAKKLKSRVVTYFNDSAKGAKTQILVGHIFDFDFMITQSEAESLVLENNLIKSHYPRYNIRLKDDRSYPYVKIDLNHAYPRVEIQRRPKKQKNVALYGPFPHGSALFDKLRVITKAFRLRDCSDYEFAHRKNPCLLYQMHQCSAPCVKEIDQDSYGEDLESAVNIIKGKKSAHASLKLIEEQMLVLSEAEEFEQAAQLRDYLNTLTDFVNTSYDQSVELMDEKDMDVFAYYEGDVEVDFSLYMIRRGNLLGHKNFHYLKDDFIEDLSDFFELFIYQYYSNSDEIIPEKVVIDLSEEQLFNIQEGLKKLDGVEHGFEVRSAKRKYKGLVDSVQKHAEEKQKMREKNQSSEYVGLSKLQSLLKLKERPQTLECYDIAIWQGKSPTASQVVFYEGRALKERYRYYHLEERPEGNNDFAMMQEVFARRLKKGDLPDVFVVDGGIAQVNAVKKILDEFEVTTPIVGIAKSRDLSKGYRAAEMKKSEERLIIPNRANPYFLSKTPSLFRILVQMRDEAHRFSRKLHHKKEKSRVLSSWLDDVKGIGEKTKEQILKQMNLTQEEVSKLNVDEIERTLGIKKRHAKIIYDHLHANFSKA